jgi:hypothetical protein
LARAPRPGDGHRARGRARRLRRRDAPGVDRRRQTRACGLFADAAAAPKRVRKASATLGGSIAVVSKARKSGKISTGCADALKAALRDAKDRAGRFLKTLGAARRSGREGREAR